MIGGQLWTCRELKQVNERTDTCWQVDIIIIIIVDVVVVVEYFLDLCHGRNGSDLDVVVMMMMVMMVTTLSQRAHKITTKFSNLK